MAENSEEISVINHLLKVEKEAYSLIDDAMKDSETRLSATKAASDAEYKEKFAECAVRLEQDYQNKLNSLNSTHESLLKEYKSNIMSRPQNKEAFNELLDKLLFASER